MYKPQFRWLILLPLAIGPIVMRARAAPPDPLDAQARGVAEWLDDATTRAETATGSEHFDREWTFGAWQMAALGFLQHAATHPDSRDADLAHADASLELVLSPSGRAFDAQKWGVDPLDALDGTHGHIAWLGYTNLVLSARRTAGPHPRWDTLNDQLSEAIVRRLEAEPSPETFPGERYPVDVSAAVASVGEWARATGRPEPAVLARWRAALRSRWREGGLVIQAIGPDGHAVDRGRGSGTFLAAWFLSRWDRALARELYEAGRDTLLVEVGPMAGMREYAPGVDGRGDIDSGPIVGGLGVSATGFAIGAGLAVGDPATAERLRATATLVGQPVTTDGVTHWSTGAALGSAPLADAILFAMMSTPTPDHAGGAD